MNRNRVNTFFILVLLAVTAFRTYSQTQYKIYNSWNFENNELGPYTDEQIARDFKVITNYSHHSSSIAEEKLNGKTTKVLKITHPANTLSSGFDLDAQLAKDFDEVYLSYNIKFSNEFNSTTGGKIPGLGGLPCVVANKYPTPQQGFLCKSLFKPGGRIITYHYDRTTGQSPWASEEYKYNNIYFSNGTWYNVTRRVKMNTFTNGVANPDGICELWIDGRMIFKETNLKLMVTESSTMKIDDLNIAHFYGGTGDDCKPLHECYGYIDNIVVYTPEDDPTFGTKNTHDPSKVLQTPSAITDRQVYYDKMITSEGTLHNEEYGKNYSPCIDEAYVIDAGEGKTVSYKLKWAIGSNDFIYFYDGKFSDSKLIKRVAGSTSATDQVITSTGRYLFVRFSTNTDAGTTGFTGTIKFNQQDILNNPPTIVNNPPSITDQEFTVFPDNFEQLIGKIEATDTDAGQKLSFSIISGNSSGTFTINKSTGELGVSSGFQFPSDTTVYDLQVKVSDNASNPLSSTANTTVVFLGKENHAINNEPPAEDFSVYPNPTDGLIHVKAMFKPGQVIEDIAGSPLLRVIDMQGRTLYSKKVEQSDDLIETDADLSTLQNGIYFVKIQVAELSLVQKIILNK